MQRRETKMIRSLKVLGLLAVAALSMSAMFASAAQAQHQLGVYTAGITPETFTSSVIHGEQYGIVNDNFFEFFGVKTECPNSGGTFTGTIPKEGTTTLTVTPHYKDCQVPLGPTAFTMNGCDYTFTQPTRASPAAVWTAKVDLFCPVGSKIEWHWGSFPICTIKIYPAGGGTHQTLGGGVTYATGTKSNRDDITANINLTEITASKEGLCGAGHTEAGVIRSKITFTGKDEVAGTVHDLWIAPAVAGKSP
jgi:hypothetical protein